jgi:hypothetical protein
VIAVEYFTKCLEVYAVPNQEALTMADALVSSVALLQISKRAAK